MTSTSRRLLQQGFSLTELVMVVGTAAILGGLLVFVLNHDKQKQQRRPHQGASAREINCVNNLKQLGLACRIWEGDNGDKFPMAVPTAQGGTMEFTTGADTFRHFQVMSNELSTPKILVCPADTRIAAADFTQLKNQNVSYFVGLDANDATPQMFLSGDRNLTGPSKPEDGILKLSPGDAASWTAEMHGNRGNIGLADGSVMRLDNSSLRPALKNSGAATNVWRIALPE